MHSLPSPTTLWRDTRGQALTEFAIVIPVVLMFFLAMIQYLQIFRASQHVSYAAYVAARSFAVHGSVDGTEEATRLALDSAALALAPVAKPAPGEYLGIGSLSAGGPKFAKLLEGFLVARYIRLNPKLGGGSLNISRGRFSEAAPLQVDVRISYPQPIYIPGLAELWRFVGNGSEIGADLESLDDGLFGPISLPDRIIEAIPAELESVLPGITEQARTFIHGLVRRIVYPYVNVRGKCSLGYSDWGQKEGKLLAAYQPRLRADPASPTRETESELGRDFEKEGRDLDRAYRTVRPAVEAARKACHRRRESEAQLDKAQRDYDSTPATPPDAKRAAEVRLEAARKRADDARRAADDAEDKLRELADRLGDLSGQKYDIGTCDP